MTAPRTQAIVTVLRQYFEITPNGAHMLDEGRWVHLSLEQVAEAIIEAIDELDAPQPKWLTPVDSALCASCEREGSR